MNKCVHRLWFETCRALMPQRRLLPPEEKRLRATILKREDVCVYCGDAARTKDHFRPVIARNGMPSGYCDDEWNIVPAGQTCNSCKGNRHWRLFMEMSTPASPRGRSIPYLQRKIVVLAKFEQAGKPQTWNVRTPAKRPAAMKCSIRSMTAAHADTVLSFRTATVAASGKQKTRRRAALVRHKERWQPFRPSKPRR